jgi:hypothetical protein
MEAFEESIDDVLLVELCEEIFVCAMKQCPQIARGVGLVGEFWYVPWTPATTVIFFVPIALMFVFASSMSTISL